MKGHTYVRTYYLGIKLFFFNFITIIDLHTYCTYVVIMKVRCKFQEC